MDADTVLGTESTAGSGERIYRSDDSGIYPEDGIPIIEPSTISFQPDASEYRSKRRGRPKGSVNSGSKREKKENANDITQILLSLHTMVAAASGISELEIEESEAKKISDAIARVNEFYGGIVLPEKYMVWGQFAMAMGSVYGPRAIAYSVRLKHEAKNGTKTVDVKPTRVM